MLDLKKLSLEELNNLHCFSWVLLDDTQIFNPLFPSREEKFEIRSKISIIRMAHDNDGMPGHQAIPRCQFNWKEWFERLNRAGHLEIVEESRPLGFQWWIIKANRQSIEYLKIESEKLLGIKNGQKYNDYVEVKIRDTITNNPTIQIPTLASGGIYLSNPEKLKMRNVEIDECGEIDIACYSGDTIKYIFEITCGSVTDKYTEKRIPDRINTAPGARIIVIAPRINDNILRKMTRLGADIVLFSSLKKISPKLFHFLNILLLSTLLAL